MIRRALSLLLVLLTGMILFYISRFWDFRWWGREGLFGIDWIRPQGGLLATWLRGTNFAVYELLIWGLLCVLVLTLLDRLLRLLNR